MAKGSVLVVDDDPTIVHVLADALELDGYHVVIAANDQALQLAHELHPDLILLDLMMPGIDGVEISKRLRGDPATARIPIVVTSARYDLKAALSKAPVDSALPKPFELDDLYAVVNRLVPSE